MKKHLVGALVLTGFFAIGAQAQEENSQAAETKASASSVNKGVVEVKSGEADVDEVITNRKLRAETGAKSKYSFSAALSYSGGTVNNPGSDVRPNIASSTFVPIQPALGGSLGGKYKISALQSLSADVGLTIYKPFHKDDKKSFGDRSNVANPSLTYQQMYQAAGIQNVSAIGATWITDRQFRDNGQVASVAVSQTAIYDFGGSIFSAGLAGEVGYTIFDKHDMEMKQQQSDYYFALYPFAELNLTDRFNLRTVFRPWIFEHVRSEAFGDVVRNVYTQSFGLGISVTRDIFLYPNVQFAPEDMRSDRTNVGLTANINI